MARTAGLVFTVFCLLVAGCSARGGTSKPAAPSSPPARTSPGAPSSPGAVSAVSSAAPSAAPTPAPGPSVSTAPPVAGGPTSPVSGVPVLGQGRGITRGYGSARPDTIFNGGDPTGLVTGVSWQSWGGAKAVGTGMGYYDPPNEPVSRSVRERATVVAFDLGTCAGKYMYRAVEWYFPQSGGSFSRDNYIDVCAWTYHGDG